MNECNHDCGSCSANCDSRKVDRGEFLEALNPASFVRRIIGVVSGKGEVDKSPTISMLVVSMDRKGKKAAVLDANITGPPTPMASGIGNEGMAALPDGSLMSPAKSTGGVEIMSTNLLLDKDTGPIIWRGPTTAGAVKQFWSETLWQDVDYMLVGMPSGIDDMPLTVLQLLPVDGIIIVTSPQELVGMIMAKAMDMVKEMDIPTVGVVENMGYLECPDCDKRISMFGESHVGEVTAEHGIKVLAQIPTDPTIVQMVDVGRVEYLEMPWFDEAVEVVEAL